MCSVSLWVVENLCACDFGIWNLNFIWQKFFDITFSSSLFILLSYHPNEISPYYFKNVCNVHISYETVDTYPTENGWVVSMGVSEFKFRWLPYYPHIHPNSTNSLVTSKTKFSVSFSLLMLLVILFFTTSAFEVTPNDKLHFRCHFRDSKFIFNALLFFFTSHIYEKSDKKLDDDGKVSEKLFILPDISWYNLFHIVSLHFMHRTSSMLTASLFFIFLFSFIQFLRLKSSFNRTSNNAREDSNFHNTQLQPSLTVFPRSIFIVYPLSCSVIVFHNIYRMMAIRRLQKPKPKAKKFATEWQWIAFCPYFWIIVCGSSTEFPSVCIRFCWLLAHNLRRV